MGHYPSEGDNDDVGSGAAPHEGMSASKYMATRFSSLRPPMLNVPNPLKLVRMVNGQQWAFFLLAFFAWVSFQALRASRQDA